MRGSKLGLAAWVVLTIAAASHAGEPATDVGITIEPSSGAGPEVAVAINALLDHYLQAFNARDAAAWSATLHYPHVRIAGGKVKVWQTPEEYAGDWDFQQFAADNPGWSSSRWNEKRILHARDDKAHVTVRFTRYRADGSAVASFDALYVLTRVDGHWGVQARSSFAP